MTEGSVNATDSRRNAVAGAGLVFALAVPVTYALERAWEWSRGEGGDPRLLLRTLHTVYFWRVAIAVWWGLFVALVAFAWLGRVNPSEAKLGRALQLVVALALPLIVLFSFLVP